MAALRPSAAIKDTMALYTDEQQKAFFRRSKEILEAGPVEAEAFVEELRELIVFHEWRYYIRHDPVLSDYEYDRLYGMLKSLEEQYPEWVVPDSPTQRVSDELAEEFPAVAHLTPMLSLENSYNAEDLFDFDRQVRKLAGLGEDERPVYTIEPKFDGGSVALVYEGDRLLRAATRGDGVRGEEVTANMKALRSVPLTAAFSKMGIHRAELRGEALIRKDRFADINKRREAEGLPLFANPRNAATGSLRMKDPRETAARGVELFVFQLGFAEDSEGRDLTGKLGTHYDSLQFLDSLGFKVPVAGRLKRLRASKLSFPIIIP